MTGAWFDANYSKKIENDKDYAIYWKARVKHILDEAMAKRIKELELIKLKVKNN